MPPGVRVQDLDPDRIKYATAAMNPRLQTDSPTDAGIKSNPTRAAPANTPKIAIRMLRQMRFIIFIKQPFQFIFAHRRTSISCPPLVVNSLLLCYATDSNCIDKTKSIILLGRLSQLCCFSQFLLLYPYRTLSG